MVARATPSRPPARHGTRVRAAFADLTGRSAAAVWFAPGRVNVIGEHTDYNDGFVLPIALASGVACAAGPRPDGLLRVASVQVADPPVVLPLDRLGPGAASGWAAYPAGVVWALAEAGVTVPGVDLVLDGDVPLGAGLSSSAAVEAAVATAVAALAGSALADDPAGRLVLARVAQRAEHEAVGMPCGIMDQAAALLSRPGHALFLDTRTLVGEPVPFDLQAAGLVLLVVDTRAPHRLVDGEYAARRAACERAAATLGVPALRDVADLAAALPRLPDEESRRRVRHVVTENERVLDVVARLRAGDLRGIGPLLTASHASLRDDFEVSVPELDVAVAAAVEAGALGARMTGGGFGGCVIALVDAVAASGVSAAVAAAFDRRGFAPPAWFTVTPGPGAHPIPPNAAASAAGPNRPTTEGDLP